MVEVTQEDREAAWPQRPDCYCDEDEERWMKGTYDSIPCIQAFARHRQAGVQQGLDMAAGVVDDL